MNKNKHKGDWENKISVAKTGVTRYYAVHLGGVAYTVTEMYDANADFTERTIVELQTEKKPTAEIQRRISQAIADCEAHS